MSRPFGMVACAFLVIAFAIPEATCYPINLSLNPTTDLIASPRGYDGVYRPANTPENAIDGNPSS